MSLSCHFWVGITSLWHPVDVVQGTSSQMATFGHGWRCQRLQIALCYCRLVLADVCCLCYTFWIVLTSSVHNVQMYYIDLYSIFWLKVLPCQGRHRINQAGVAALQHPGHKSRGDPRGSETRLSRHGSNGLQRHMAVELGMYADWPEVSRDRWKFTHLLLSGIKSLSLGRKFIHFLVNAYRTALQVQMRNCKMQKNNMVSFVWFLFCFSQDPARRCACPQTSPSLSAWCWTASSSRASIVESTKNTH